MLVARQVRLYVYDDLCGSGHKSWVGNATLEISLHMMDFYDHVRCMERDDWDGVAHLVLGPGTNSAHEFRDLSR